LRWLSRYRLGRTTSETVHEEVDVASDALDADLELSNSHGGHLMALVEQSFGWIPERRAKSIAVVGLERGYLVQNVADQCIDLKRTINH
jgi:hypothetical protein